MSVFLSFSFSHIFSLTLSFSHILYLTLSFSYILSHIRSLYLSCTRARTCVLRHRNAMGNMLVRAQGSFKLDFMRPVKRINVQIWRGVATIWDTCTRINSRVYERVLDALANSTWPRGMRYVHEPANAYFLRLSERITATEHGTECFSVHRPVNKNY